MAIALLLQFNFNFNIRLFFPRQEYNHQYCWSTSINRLGGWSFWRAKVLTLHYKQSCDLVHLIHDNTLHAPILSYNL